MNLLIEQAPDYIVVGGEKIKINTSFSSWVRFFIAYDEQDGTAIENALKDIFPEGIPETDISETMAECIKWLFPADSTKHEGNYSENKNGALAFDFAMDGNIIYCELWEYFPHLMERGITFHEGMQLIKILMSDERTLLYHRAFARCGDFSKMDKEQKAYWIKERAKWIIRAKQNNIDDVFARAF